jgi:hypothetical protein
MPGTNAQQNPCVWLLCYALEIGEDTQIAIVPACHPINPRVLIALTHFEPIHEISPVSSSNTFF